MSYTNYRSRGASPYERRLSALERRVEAISEIVESIEEYLGKMPDETEEVEQPEPEDKGEDLKKASMEELVRRIERFPTAGKK